MGKIHYQQKKRLRVGKIWPNLIPRVVFLAVLLPPTMNLLNLGQSLILLYELYLHSQALFISEFDFLNLDLSKTTCTRTFIISEFDFLN